MLNHREKKRGAVAPQFNFTHSGLLGGCVDDLCSVQFVQSFLETIGVRTFCLTEGFKPVSNFVKAFLARGACHARIHICVFMRFAGDRGFQIVTGGTDGQSGCRITGFFEVLQMTMCVSGFAFCC